MTQMEVRSTDLQRVVRDIRRAGLMTVSSDIGGASEVSFISEMSKNIRAELKPVVVEIRAAVMAIPSHSSRQLTGSGRRTKRAGRSDRAVAERPRGLRDATARGVQMKVNLSGKNIGVRLRVDPRHFPAGQKHLPQLLEGTRPRWRSPSWGHDPWKTQPAHPYFFRTIQPHIPRIQAAITREVNKAVRELGGGAE